MSDDILRDMKEAAGGYGVTILRADVKDLVFPGNLQEIMNRVLAAARMSQAQLVEARTKADVQRIASQANAESQRLEVEAKAEAERLAAQLGAEIHRIKTESDVAALRQREEAARAYKSHPALLRLQELETLRELGRNGNARIYIGFDKHFNGRSDREED